MNGGVLKSLLTKKIVYIISVAKYSIYINNIFVMLNFLLII